MKYPKASLKRSEMRFKYVVRGASIEKTFFGVVFVGYMAIEGLIAHLSRGYTPPCDR